MHTKILICGSLAVVLSTAVSQADVVVTNDAHACPSIADHQKFLAEIVAKNWTYTYPSKCAELVQGGRRYAGPFETREAPYAGEATRFVLIEVPRRGRLWVPAFWIEEVKDGVSPVPVVAFLSDSRLWYAKPLRERLGRTFSLHGTNYDSARLPCLPADITKFDFAVSQRDSVLAVEGSLGLGRIPNPFKVIDGAQGSRYMLLLEAYLFAPNGTLVWHQQGFPKGDAWVKATGDSVSFALVGDYRGATSGYDLWVVAAGDPLLSSTSETRAILGAKRTRLP